MMNVGVCSRFDFSPVEGGGQGEGGEARRAGSSPKAPEEVRKGRKKASQRRVEKQPLQVDGSLRSRKRG